MKKFTLMDGSALVIWLLPAIYLLFTYNSLPQSVPMHYDLNGAVNRYGDKSEFFIILGLPVLVYLLLKFLPAIDPKKKVKYSEASFQKLALGMVVFLSAITIIFIFSTLHPGIKPGKLILPVIGLLFAFMGNVMYNIKPNYFVGIRTPWTLESEDNWRSTHRLAGKIWFVGGIVLTIAILLIPERAGTIVFMCVAVIIALVPVIYSYVYFKRYQLNQNS